METENVTVTAGLEASLSQSSQDRLNGLLGRLVILETKRGIHASADAIVECANELVAEAFRRGVEAGKSVSDAG